MGEDGIMVLSERTVKKRYQSSLLLDEEEKERERGEVILREGEVGDGVDVLGRWWEVEE